MTDIFKQFLTSTQAKNAVKQADAAAKAIAKHCDERIAKIRSVLENAETALEHFADYGEGDDGFPDETNLTVTWASGAHVWYGLTIGDLRRARECVAEISNAIEHPYKRRTAPRPVKARGAAG